MARRLQQHQQSGCNGISEAVCCVVTSFQRTYSLQQGAALSSPAAAEPVLPAGRPATHDPSPSADRRSSSAGALRHQPLLVDMRNSMCKQHGKPPWKAATQALWAAAPTGLNTSTHMSQWRNPGPRSWHLQAGRSQAGHDNLAHVVQRSRGVRYQLSCPGGDAWRCAALCASGAACPCKGGVRSQLAMSTHSRQRPGWLGPGSCMDMRAHTVMASCLAGLLRHHAPGSSNTRPRWLLPPHCERRPWPHIPAPAVHRSRPNESSLSQPSSLPDDGQERQAGQDALRQLALRALQQRRPLAGGAGSAAPSIRRAFHGARRARLMQTSLSKSDDA